MYAALQAICAILTGVAMSLSLAHALELPGKLRLSREEYLIVQPIYYPGFTYAGVAEPLAILFLATLLALTPVATPGFWIIGGALVAATLTHVAYWTLTAPPNRYWLRTTKLSAAAKRFFDAGTAVDHSDWKSMRDRWERSHILRAATATAAFVLVVMSLVAR